MITRRWIRPTLAAAALLAAVVTGCMETSGRIAAPLTAAVGDVQATSDTVITEFRVNPLSSTNATVGAHKVNFPAGTVCDPLLSTYGPTEWDQPCIVATLPVTVRAKSWTDVDGHSHVEFSPALRFVPTSNARRFVTLQLANGKDAADPSTRILFCMAADVCADESVADSTMTTKHDRTKGVVTRRIKHFSGYNVTAGFAPQDETVIDLGM